LAYETVQDIFAYETGDNAFVPGMIATIQSFGDLLNFHCHIHGIVTEGVFIKDGHFVPITDFDLNRATVFFQEKTFNMLLTEKKITPEIIQNMQTWEHSGFSIDTSVRLQRNDQDGLKRLTEYISRSPVSISRIVSLSDNGNLIYRSSKPSLLHPFPEPGNESLDAGVPRNFEIFDPLVFLAEFSQHIPNKGEHMVHYYGWYSNKNRGVRKKQPLKNNRHTPAFSSTLPLPDPDSEYTQKRHMTWAALIKSVLEVDPLLCPKCGGTMKIIALIDKKQEPVIKKILKHCGLWNNPPPHPPPKVHTAPDMVTPDGKTFSYHGDAFCQLPAYSDENFSQDIVYTQYN